jgi:hypothetical protein
MRSDVLSPSVKIQASAAAGATATADLSATITCLGHDNGLGQTYADCAPLGTYTVDTATGAAQAFIAHFLPIYPDPFSGSGGWSTSTQPCGDGVVVTAGSLFAPIAAAWAYSGSAAGHARAFEGLGAAVICPTTADPAWN